MLGKCEFCKKIKLGITEYTVYHSPGRARTHQICKDCHKEGRLPIDFYDYWGISASYSPGARFIKMVGTPTITDNMFGYNAFGSIQALYSDGSKLAVCCGHGGSAWLCLECAEKAIEEEITFKEGEDNGRQQEQEKENPANTTAG